MAAEPVLPPEVAARIDAAIEHHFDEADRLIAIRDHFDGDPDFEGHSIEYLGGGATRVLDPDFEGGADGQPDDDGEPWLAAPESGRGRSTSQLHWSQGALHDGEEGDDNGIADADGKSEQIRGEPSLGSLGSCGSQGSQTNWAGGGTDDREFAVDDEGEETNEDGDGDPDKEPSIGATHADNQEHAWALADGSGSEDNGIGDEDGLDEVRAEQALTAANPYDKRRETREAGQQALRDLRTKMPSAVDGGAPVMASARANIEVYDGQHHLGTIVETEGGNWSAYDPNGRRVGVFLSRLAAQRALAEARRGDS